MRRRFGVWCGLLALIVGAQVSGATSSANAVGAADGGVYVPVTPINVVNATSSGSGAFTAGQTRTYAIAGHAGVPASGVSAVVVDIAAKTTTATTSSYVTAWAAGATRPVVSSLYYDQANAPRSNTAVVPLGTSGSISVYNYTGTTGITVDLQGYFTTASTASSTGGFVALKTPIRIANTATGQSVPLAKLAVSGNLDVQVTGQGGIPSTATSVFANIEVRNATAGGNMRVGPGGTTLTGASAIDYGDDGPYDSGVSIKLNPSTGKMRILNAAGSSVDIKVDVQGYYSGDPTQGGSFHPLNPTNVYSTSSTGQVLLQPKETRSVKVAGVGGLPAAGTLGAVALTAQVKNWTVAGTVAVFSNDIKWPGTTNVSFTGGQGEPANGISSTLMTAVSDNGYVAVYNTSTQPVSLTLTTQGWFSDPDKTPDPDDNVSAVSGTIAGVSTLANAQFSVSLDPNEAQLAAQTEGTETPYYALPSESVHTDGNTYQVVVDPSTIPAGYLESDGTATFEIMYSDSTQNLNGATTISAQVINHAVATQSTVAARTWTDPTDNLNAPAVDDSAPPSVDGVDDGPAIDLTPDADSTPASDDSGTSSDEADADTGDDSDSSTITPVADAAVTATFAARTVTAQSSPNVKATLLKRYTKYATIGTTYPVSQTTAFMRLKGAQTHTFGVGTTLGTGSGASVSADGSKSVHSSWTETWGSSGQWRSYRVEMLYGKYLMVNQITGYSWNAYRPIKLTGHGKNHRLYQLPNWGHCGPVPVGTWLRSQGKGKAYTDSAGVKIADIIGIDLSSKHSWSKDIDTGYVVKESNLQMCGSNDYPATSSKVAMKMP